MRTVKIVCTLGPRSASPTTLAAMVAAGMDVARLNASHGTTEDLRRMARATRVVADEAGRPVAVMLDLQGPRVRVGEVGTDGVRLVPGEEVTLVATPGETGLPAAQAAPRPRTSEVAVPVGYPWLARDVRPGDPVLLDDGRLRLRVVATEETEVRCRVEVGGILRSRKGVNLPASALSVPAFTEKDRRDLGMGLEMGVDLVALSFVRSRDDVRHLREAMAGHPDPPPVIAKIEKPQALENLDGILDEADGVMVARGDLGVEMPLERVPGVQAQVIRAANARGKEVIVATQMLESMVREPTPTRAEVTDVAVAVMEGADAVMLSAETAIGTYPVEAVRTVAAVIEAASTGPEVFPLPAPAFIPGMDPVASAVGRAAVDVSRALEIRTIACYTRTGRTARFISDYRPRVPILALTDRPSTCRRMALLWGVIPRLVAIPGGTSEMLALVAGEARALGLAGTGDRVLVTLGYPPGSAAGTNLLAVHTLP